MHQGRVNGFTRHELLAHHPHGHVHAFANQRFSALADQPPQGGAHARFAVGADQFAGEQQTPGRCVHEQRRTATEVGRPLPLGDLVADQGVAGVGIGNAQQGFGQTHQGHALL